MSEGIFPLGDVALEHGGVLRDAHLAFAMHGALNDAGDNCILIPTYFMGTHRSYGAMIGEGRALDPGHYCIIIVNMFGNGLSTSPSHYATPQIRAAFPSISIADNVVCQRRLLQALGVRGIALITGWSMGAMQAYHWAARYPEMVRALLPVCGTARCWPLNRAFLEGVRGALLADPAFAGGYYDEPPTRGLRAFGRAYAGWAYSAAFFRDALYKHLGHATLEDLLVAWEEDHLGWDACDLLAMLSTWADADIARLAPDRDYRTALSSITARTIVMPADRDAYFTAEECQMEADAIAGAEFRPLASPHGHCAGAPGRFPEETAQIEVAMRVLLEDRSAMRTRKAKRS